MSPNCDPSSMTNAASRSRGFTLPRPRFAAAHGPSLLGPAQSLGGIVRRIRETIPGRAVYPSDNLLQFGNLVADAGELSFDAGPVIAGQPRVLQLIGNSGAGPLQIRQPAA